jgi:hypothetical protein
MNAYTQCLLNCYHHATEAHLQLTHLPHPQEAVVMKFK